VWQLAAKRSPSFKDSVCPRLKNSRENLGPIFLILVERGYESTKRTDEEWRDPNSPTKFLFDFICPELRELSVKRLFSLSLQVFNYLSNLKFSLN